LVYTVIYIVALNQLIDNRDQLEKVWVIKNTIKASVYAEKS
jgi:hypothetical protein